MTNVGRTTGHPLAGRAWRGARTIVEYIPHMKIVQVVLDAVTLREADRGARRAKVSRSELVRRAIRAYVANERARAQEERQRAGYQRHPERADEFGGFEGSWPDR
jgi:hypothetical protein